MDEVERVILERIRHDRREYSAVPDINGCKHCAFEEDRVNDCQSYIEQTVHSTQSSVYCVPSKNPHGVGIIWVKTEDVPKYLATAVIHRMENSTEE